MFEVISTAMLLVGFFEKLFGVTKGTMKFLRFSILKLSIAGALISVCTLSIANNFGYETFLKIHNKYKEFRLKSEITKTSQQLDEVYKKIGQGIYNKENAEYLTNLAQQYNQKLLDLKNEIAVSEDNMKKKILLEKTLKDLTAKEVKVKLSAIDKLGEIGDKKFMPYLSLTLSDSNEQVRWKAMSAIQKLEGKNEGN